MASDDKGTADAAYTRYLLDNEKIWWKRLLDVQLPYRTHLKALRLGVTLDIGCGIGRNLRHLAKGSVGIDHNLASVEHCRQIGLEAYLPDDFFKAPSARTFDAILLAHVAEHMKKDEVVALLRPYLAHLRPGGRLVVLTPQEKGFTLDETHVEMMDYAALRHICAALALPMVRQYSFPFPRLAGRVFPYNEFVSIAQKP